MTILLTGAAGFIGMHTALRLLERGDVVVGIDNLNPYYDVNLKRARLANLTAHHHFSFYPQDIAESEAMAALFAQIKPQRVIHLAAQAGVRYAVTHPHAYIRANIQGFMAILEGCRQQRVEHLVYASSSSVYGANACLPFDEQQTTNHPLSLYAATKKSNELMAHTYSHLYQIPTTGLRFFTVYGPWGRPDMALFQFTRAMLRGEPIEIFNHGQMVRDFTYIDDVVESIIRIHDNVATVDTHFDAKHPNPASSHAPYRVFNIGNSQAVLLLDYIRVLEQVLGVNADKRYLTLQPGDVLATAANSDALAAWINFSPNTPVQQGVAAFVDWYRSYYGYC